MLGWVGFNPNTGVLIMEGHLDTGTQGRLKADAGIGVICEPTVRQERLLAAPAAGRAKERCPPREPSEDE